MIRRLVVAAAVLAPPVIAQGDCFPGKESNEAKTFAILSVPLAFAQGGPVLPDGWNVGVEAVSVPGVPRDIATPTTCRPGKGPENTDPVPGVVRLRAGMRHGAWIVDAGWIPPVTVSGVRANLVGIAVARPIVMPPGWMLTPRLHATFGSIHAPVTCDDDALADPSSECFNGTRSNDRWTPGIFGAELTVSRGAGWFLLHAGGGWTLLRPRFQVNFTNSIGETDRRKVEVDLSRVAAFAGATVAAGRFRVSAEGYATLGEPIAARVVARVPMGGS